MKYEVLSERNGGEVRVTCPKDLMPYLSSYSKKRQECFIAITMNGNQEVIRIHLVTLGILNRTLIHPREIFVRAIKDHAASLIICHNHPSGSLEPSKEDREATKRLQDAGKLLGIEVLDHLIISKAGYFSFREQGDLL